MKNQYLVAWTAQKLSQKSDFFKWEIGISVEKNVIFLEVVPCKINHLSSFFFWQTIEKKCFQILSKILKFLTESSTFLANSPCACPSDAWNSSAEGRAGQLRKGHALQMPSFIWMYDTKSDKLCCLNFRIIFFFFFFLPCHTLRPWSQAACLSYQHCKLLLCSACTSRVIGLQLLVPAQENTA